MESALPISDKGEGLRKGLTDDVAGFLRLEQIRVKRRDLHRQIIGSSFDLRIEDFKMIVDNLNGFLHFFCTMAGNRDLDVIFCFHIFTYLIS